MLAGLAAKSVSTVTLLSLTLLLKTIRYTVKNIVLAGFGHITLLDLDTIDLSNLNRQFLFRKKDVKQSKAMVCHIRLYSLSRHTYVSCTGCGQNGIGVQP